VDVVGAGHLVHKSVYALGRATAALEDGAVQRLRGWALLKPEPGAWGLLSAQFRRDRRIGQPALTRQPASRDDSRAKV
jgi:hypothetical protein